MCAVSNRHRRAEPDGGFATDLVRHLRIFVSSPSDVPEERQIVREVIKQLQYEPQFRDKVYLEPVAWDEPGAGTPMLATMNPQAAINAGLPMPADCHIVVVIFWARMGTALPYPEYKKKNGKPYDSGAEWEYENAIEGHHLHGIPDVLVYRRTEKVLLDDEAPDYEQKLAQKRLVKKFFEQFVDPKTGAILRGVNLYEKPEDFRRDLANHLRKRIGKLVAEKATGPMPPKRPAWSGSPFPGLRAFTNKDAPIFFGRGRETDDLVNRINHYRFVTVVGASGSGKSSLVWAGLIPRLEANAVSSERTGSKDWLWLRLTPGEVSESATASKPLADPFMALAVKLEPHLPGREARDIAATLAADPAALSQLIPQILSGRPYWAELLLFVDQFEELVSLVSPTHRVPFVKMLCRTVAGGRFRAVATLRADFYHQMIPVSADLVQLLRTGSYPLGAPDAVSLHEMIVRPAELAGLRFEGGLDRRIVQETGNEPGALALMAYLLDELYRRRTADGCLSLQAYSELGGVAGAIGQRAEQVFRSLSAAAQAALPRVFLRLVEVDERGTATRRRALRAEIERSAPEAAEELLTAFTQARLLVADQPRESPTVEVAHEALLRKWDRLASWIEQTQDDLRLLRQVKLAAVEWGQNSRQDAFRWPDERLKPAYAMTGRLELDHARDFNEIEREFIRRESDRLLEEIKNPDTPHIRRSWIGERLAMIGDPRPGVGLRPDGLPDIEWCSVELKGKSSVEVDVEKVGKVKVDLPFYIARYPVTYSQFQAFIEAPDGYHNRDRDWFEGLAASDDGKRLHEQRFKFSNHPREVVNWYQALAFCRWLSWRLEHGPLLVEEGWPEAGVVPLKRRSSHSETRASDLLNLSARKAHPKAGEARGFDLLNPFAWALRLPTEAEWQFAAAGPSAKTYPWGNDWDGRYANTVESGLSRTTAVGMYPAGAASCGALDLSGNVLE